MEGFGFRGLEFHNNRMWKWESVHRALDFMEKYDLNALIFHQNDLIDFLVEPKAYFFRGRNVGVLACPLLLNEHKPPIYPKSHSGSKAEGD